MYVTVCTCSIVGGVCVCSVCVWCVCSVCVCAGECSEDSISSMPAPSISRFMRLNTAEYRDLPHCVPESGNCQ